MTENAKKSGRPVAFERQQAVNAAMHLFWKKGFLSVSAKDLAEAMSIQRSSFYNSFGSREALLREVLLLYGSQAPDAVLDQIHKGDAVIPVVVAMFRTLCHERANDKEMRGCLVCNGVAELVGVEDEVGPLFEQAVQHRIDTFEKLLHQAIGQHEIATTEDPAVTAKSIIAFLFGLNVFSKVIHDESQLWSCCRQFLSSLGIDKALLDDAS